jgi:predicted PurR-regulated permease PerM
VTPGNEGRPGRVLLKFVVATASMLLAAFLLGALRSLIVPVVVSALLAYICRPLVAGLERYRVPRVLGIATLLFVFVLAILAVVSRVGAVMPSENAAIEFRIRALHGVNDRYAALMGLDSSLSEGNRIYRWLQADLDPLVDRATELLSLSDEERSEFLALRRDAAAPAGSDKLLDEDRANLKVLKMRARTARTKPGALKSEGRADALVPKSLPSTHLAVLGEIVSTWIIAPLVFLFLLRDNGEIKRGLLSLVPNRLFEPVLNIMADLDAALGNWARGLFLECSLLALTLMLLLTIVGIPLRWAVGIGLIAGASNVVPYLGSAIALVSALAYALVAEGIHPVLPMMDTQNIAIWVIAVVGFAEALKNAVYGPLVLGGAVKLHPLVVVIGAAGGAIMFGVAGVLLAIPAIVVFKVFVSSAARQLKAYGLV